MMNSKPQAYHYIDFLPQKKQHTNKNKTNIIMPAALVRDLGMESVFTRLASMLL
jgi:hypothetical protein